MSNNENILSFPWQKIPTNTVMTVRGTSPSTEYGSGSYAEARPEYPLNNWKRYQMQSMMGLDYVPCIEFTEQYYDIVEYYTRGPGHETY